MIYPGEVNWMTAGRAITHSERTSPQTRAGKHSLFGIQTWVALPEKEETAPTFEHHAKEALPLVEGEGTEVRLILGNAYGERAPVNILSQMFYADAVLQPGAVIPLPVDHEDRGVYVVKGSTTVARQEFEAGRMMVFRPGDNIHIQAGEQGAQLMLLGGETSNEPRYIWWNFVSSSKDRIEHAKEEWIRGDWNDGSFTLPPGPQCYLHLLNLMALQVILRAAVTSKRYNVSFIACVNLSVRSDAGCCCSGTARWARREMLCSLLFCKKIRQLSGSADIFWVNKKNRENRVLAAARILILVLSSAFACHVAMAHPHVWITATAELVFDEDNRFVAVRHKWKFDEAFAAYATQGMDKNRDGIFTRRELAKLASKYVEYLADFYHFTFVTMGDDDVEFAPGEDYWLEYENSVLTLFYTLPMQEPLAADPDTGFSNLTVEIFDPMFFVAVEFAQNNPVILKGPQVKDIGCVASVEYPQELDPTQAQLLANIGPSENIPDDLAPDIDYLANTIALECTPS